MVWHLKHHSELSFGGQGTPLAPNVAKNQMVSAEKGEEIIVVGDEEAEMDTGGHSATNPVEAHHHVQCLDKAMQTIQAKVDAGGIKDILKDALEEVYIAICIMNADNEGCQHLQCPESNQGPDLPSTAQGIRRSGEAPGRANLR